jgi:hypothetical protein
VKGLEMKKSISLFSVLYDFLINFALIGMGYLIYYHFNVHSLAPVGWNPIVLQFFGSQPIATLILSGIPFIVGISSLARTVYRLLIALNPHPVKI